MSGSRHHNGFETFQWAYVLQAASRCLSNLTGYCHHPHHEPLGNDWLTAMKADLFEKIGAAIGVAQKMGDPRTEVLLRKAQSRALGLAALLVDRPELSTVRFDLWTSETRRRVVEDIERYAADLDRMVETIDRECEGAEQPGRDRLQNVSGGAETTLMKDQANSRRQASTRPLRDEDDPGKRNASSNMRSGPFNLELDCSNRIATREEMFVEFKGKEIPWNLLLRLANRYPSYYPAVDLGRNAGMKGYDGEAPEHSAVHNQITTLRRLITKLNLAIECPKNLGYRLEEKRKTAHRTKSSRNKTR
jgi:hypothetical protein